MNYWYSRTSISARLVVAFAALLAVAFVLTGLGFDMIYRQSAADALQERLTQATMGVGSLLRLDAQGGLDTQSLEPVTRVSSAASGRYTMVRDRAGARLWQSPHDEPFGFDVGSLPEAGARPQVRTVQGVDEPYAVMSTNLLLQAADGQQHELVVTVAEARAGSVVRLAQFRRQTILWFGVVTVVMLVVLGVFLGRVLGPLHRLGLEIADIEVGARSELGENYPSELAGAARSLNALLRAEQLRMRRYRDTLGNLAHGLKTPLAVMRAALAGLGSETRATIDAEIDRIAQLADHQLSRAATAGAVTFGQKAVAVAPVAAELRATLLRVHGAKDISIEVLAGPELGFLGDRSDIVELLGNVLDNACKWCRSVVHLQLRIDLEYPQSRCLQIRVTDDGPGIAPADRERVLARGVRIDERSPGHGLGLAMVADTVALYGGDLSIGQSAALGGASIEIRLPGKRLEGPP
jgi:two-component system sensor histidine kinase PhoQ